MVQSAAMLFKHMFVWGQESAIWKNVGDVNECAVVPCANQKLTRYREVKHRKTMTPQIAPRPQVEF